MRGGMGQRLSSGEDVKYNLRKLSSESLRVLKNSMQGQLIGLVLATMLTFVIAGTSVFAPLLTQRAIDNYISLGDWNGLLLLMSLYILMVAIEWIASFGQTLLAHKVAYGSITRLRSRVFAHTMELDLAYHHDNKVGHTSSMIMNDTETLFSLISQGFVYFISDLVTIVAIFVTLFSLSPRLALVITFTMPITLLGTQLIGKLVRFAQRQVRQNIADLTAGVEQNISGAKDVKALSQEGRQAAKVEELSRATKDANIKSAAASALMFPMMDLTAAIGLGAVIWQGGFLFSRGDITFGVFTAALLYVRRIHGPLMDLSQIYTPYQTAGAALERIASLLNLSPKVLTPSNPVTALSWVGAELSLQNVGFAYGEADIFHGVTLTIPYGSRIGIVGPSGAGKSTLVKLLGRLHDPGEGTIALGGVDLRSIAPEVLRSKIQIIPQDTYLFPMKVWENICYGLPGVTRQQVSELSDRLDLTSFFSRLKDGLDTVVQEGGKTLSGGQRQAVAILRAVIRDPDIIILDEAASHLDPQIEQVVYQNVKALWQDKTLIVVTHRTTSLGLVDRVYEVKDCRLSEIDKQHADLAGWEE